MVVKIGYEQTKKLKFWKLVLFGSFLYLLHPDKNEIKSILNDTYTLVIALYLSCPAVSQICALIVLPFITIFL